MIEEVTDVGMIEGGGRVGTGRSRRGGYGGMLRHLHDINTYKYNLGREEEDSYHGWNGGNDRGRGERGDVGRTRMLDTALDKKGGVGGGRWPEGGVTAATCSCAGAASVVEAVAGAERAGRAGLGNGRRPLGVVLGHRAAETEALNRD